MRVHRRRVRNSRSTPRDPWSTNRVSWSTVRRSRTTPAASRNSVHVSWSTCRAARSELGAQTEVLGPRKLIYIAPPRIHRRCLRDHGFLLSTQKGSRAGDCSSTDSPCGFEGCNYRLTHSALRPQEVPGSLLLMTLYIHLGKQESPAVTTGHVRGSGTLLPQWQIGIADESIAMCGRLGVRRPYFEGRPLKKYWEGPSVSQDPMFDDRVPRCLLASGSQNCDIRMPVGTAKKGTRA